MRVEGLDRARALGDHLPHPGSQASAQSQRKGDNLKGLPESQGQNLALTMLYVTYSLDSGLGVVVLVKSIMRQASLILQGYLAHKNMCHIRSTAGGANRARALCDHLPRPNVHAQ